MHASGCAMGGREAGRGRVMMVVTHTSSKIVLQATFKPFMPTVLDCHIFRNITHPQCKNFLNDNFRCRLGL